MNIPAIADSKGKSIVQEILEMLSNIKPARTLSDYDYLEIIRDEEHRNILTIIETLYVEQVRIDEKIDVSSAADCVKHILKNQTLT